MLHLAREANLPLSTAHRLVLAFEQRGFLARERRGRFLPGPALMTLAAKSDFTSVLARVSRPILMDISRQTRSVVHLGVFEHDMVTYLVKAASPRTKIFTREGCQLEAYCSGIGKVLLAFLSNEVREQYLSEGLFVSLTTTTIIDVDQLRDALNKIREQGYAVDNGEIDESIRCVAVPLFGHNREVCAAVSVLAPSGPLSQLTIDGCLATLRQATSLIEARLFPLVD